MIKALRRKFIQTSMTVVTILLLVMFGVLNIFNFISMNTYTNKLLSELVDVYDKNPAISGQELPLDMNGNSPDIQGGSNGQEEADNIDSRGESGNDFSPPDSNGDEQPEGSGSIEVITPITIQFGFMTPEITMNDILRAAYFTVTIDPADGVVYTDISHIADITEEEANAHALRIYESNRTGGWDGNYKFIAALDRNDDYVYIILDRKPDLYNQRRLLITSVIIILICLGVIFLFLYFISNKILRPVARNIEEQKNFVTNAGHEIKTPLAIIQANAEALEMFSGENKWTNNIKDQIKRLSILMNNMLTLAKAQESSNTVVIEDVDLTSLIREFMKMFCEPALRKNVRIADNVENGLIVKGNRMQAGQLISILIDNAVKYCSDDSVIDICAYAKDKNVIFEIVNACSSLPSCDPERLFERFYRPDSSRYGKEQGNGIGLSAARAIIEAFSGTITCSYEGDDKIRFVVLFKR